MADTRTRTTPTEPVGRHRSTGRPVAAAGTRAALVAGTAAAILLDAPTWLCTSLTVVAAMVTTEWVVRHRRRGLLDAALVGIAGLIVAAVLLGLVLNLTPDGLNRSSWAIGAGVLSLGALAAATRRPMPAGLLADVRAHAAARPGSRRTSTVVGVVTTLAAVAVVAVSFVAATASTRENQVAPLVVAGTATGDGSLSLQLSSGTPAGPYDVVVVGAGTTVTAATALLLDAAPVSVAVTLPAGRALVNVVPTGGGTPVRQLIYDDGVPAPAETTVETAVATPQLTATTTGDLVTGVTVAADAVTGPYDLLLTVDGRTTTVIAGFYLGGAPRELPVAVPATGAASIALVAAGSTDPVDELDIRNGRLVP